METYQKLVQAAKRGDARAFSKLYEEVYEDLYRFALYTLKHTQDAEDVVSEAVTDAWQGIKKLRDDGAFRPWIFRILTVKCKRKRKEYANKTLELPGNLAETGAELGEHADVRRAFEKLEDEERMIVALHLFGGYTSREIGRELHMSGNTVRSKQSRALKKMEISLRE